MVKHVCPRCKLEFYDPLRSRGKYSQNHHINGHVQQIAHEMGMGFEETKIRVKWAAIPFGFPPPVEIRITDEVFALFKSEADATVYEARALIEGAHLLAAEHNIRLIEETDV